MTKFAFPASLSEANSLKTVTAFNEDRANPIFIADQSHPNWDRIISGLVTGDEGVWDLFDVASGVMNQFEQVTDRVSWNGSEVLWDGDPIHNVLSEQLGRALSDGDSDSYMALAKFWEKLASNPSEHSREQAFDFLATHAFQITPEGDVVGYKGVVAMDGGKYRSVAASQVLGAPSAYVNGRAEPPLTHVKQSVGDTVSMPRSEVVHDPSQSCERGLHVATREYAASYGTVMEVHFNPRDIVSVPTADRGVKVRVCRYKVARIDSGNAGGTAVLRPEVSNTWAGDVGYSVT